MDFYIKQNGTGWEVKVNGIYQPTDPDLPGMASMSKSRAIEVAKMFQARLAFGWAANVKALQERNPPASQGEIENLEKPPAGEPEEI